MSNTLDLDLIGKEKTRLIIMVQAAIDSFYEATGYIPNITTVVSNTETSCGKIASKPFITVNVIL